MYDFSVSAGVGKDFRSQNPKRKAITRDVLTVCTIGDACGAKGSQEQKVK
jgi:hypothetical protein